MPDNDVSDGVDDVAELDAIEDVTEGEGNDLEHLREQLELIGADNQQYMADNQLGLHPLAVPQTQIRVLVNMLCPDEEERVAFDILVQQTMRVDMEAAVGEAERQRLNAQLQAGISTADVAAINGGRLPGGAVDLAALQGGNRKARREAARGLAKDMLRRDGA